MKTGYDLFCSKAIFLVFAIVLAVPAHAQDSGGFGHKLQALRDMIATKRENDAHIVSEESLGARSENSVNDSYGSRDLILYIPSKLPPMGQRAIIVALHGGGGNAQFIKDHLKIDGIAEKDGFIVAYLNGSDAATGLPGKMKAWNAGGGCCGVPYTSKVDDVGYITGAIHYLEQKYGVDPARVFGTGHSNGAIMTQTLMCETNLYKRAVSLAGSLMAEVTTCLDARGKTILAIHGTQDINVPPTGGKGSKGVTNISYKSETDSKSMFENSGGQYAIDWVASDHSLEHMADAILKSEGITLAEKEARFFGLEGR